MDPAPPNLDAWRAFGSVIGTALAFIVAWPSSSKDLIRRLVVSLICGAIFGVALSRYLGWPEEPRFALAASVPCALFAWTAIAAVNRIIRTSKTLPVKEPE